MSHRAPILPDAHIHAGALTTLGVLGGGQLGRMWAHAAQSMGYATAVLDPDAHSPAGQISQHHLAVPYLDAAGLNQLGQRCQAVTTEFENVPAPALLALAAQCPVAPAAAAVAVAQDRIAEKALFTTCAPQTGVGPAPYSVIESEAQLHAVAAPLLPGVLKTARMGYDGKGQARVADRAALANAWQRMSCVPCVLEQQLPLKDELSVLLARGHDGTVVHYPVQHNLHRDGILAVTQVWAGRLPPATAQAALAASRAIAAQFNYVGVLCLEFFVVDDGSASGQLVVNEMAPRPHNSGHYTLNACDVSQFELQVRALAGLPLVMPRQHSPAIMLNLLGDLWFAPDGSAQTPPWPQLLAMPGAHLHLYGKTQPRKGRKMGHLNITGASVEQVQTTALHAAQLLGIAPWV